MARGMARGTTGRAQTRAQIAWEGFPSIKSLAVYARVSSWTMYLLTSLLLAGLFVVAHSHFTLTYPETRGFDEDKVGFDKLS